MNANSNTIDQERWKKTATGVLMSCAYFAFAGLVLFPFNTVAGLTVWLCGMFGGALFALVQWHAIRTAYRCRECGSIFLLSALRNLGSIHLPGRSFVRCPSCLRLEWASHIIVVYG